MREITIRLNDDHAAFQGTEPGDVSLTALANEVHDVADRIAMGVWAGPILVNGEKVGNFLSETK